MDEPTSKRIVLVDKPDLQVDLEYNEFFAILHMPRLKVTKESYLDMMNYAPDLLELFQTIGFSCIHTAAEPDNHLVNKLMRRMGAKPIGEAEGYIVYEYKGAN